MNYPTPHQANTSAFRSSKTSKTPSTPDRTLRSTSSGFQVTPRSWETTRQTTVQRGQHNSHSAQESHSRQLPASNDKSNRLDRRIGSTSGKHAAVDPPTLPPRSSSTADRQQHPPSANGDWDMDTSGPISHDYPTMTQPGANALNLSRPPNTSYQAAQSTGRKEKELGLGEAKHYGACCSHRRGQKHSSISFKGQE